MEGLIRTSHCALGVQGDTAEQDTSAASGSAGRSLNIK